MFLITYIAWKGRETICWLAADNAEQAAEIASVMQGVEQIKSVERWHSNAR